MARKTYTKRERAQLICLIAEAHVGGLKEDGGAINKYKLNEPISKEAVDAMLALRNWIALEMPEDIADALIEHCGYLTPYLDPEGDSDSAAKEKRSRLRLCTEESR